MKILALSWNDVADTTIQKNVHKAGFSEKLRNEDIADDPFPASKR